MNKSKIDCRLSAMLLIFSMLCPMILEVAAQANTSDSPFGSWQPPKDFVDPVTLKIQDFKAKGLNEEQITAELEKTGMGWDPETGATWIGRTLTPEELAEMPSKSSAKATSDENTITSYKKITSAWRTWDPDWTGVATMMVSGSMDVQEGGTTSQFLCMQFGSLSGEQKHIETVLRHDLYGPYVYYTWDNDEGPSGWLRYGTKNTSITHADTYVIMMRGTQDAYGWIYDVWIEYEWVRSGHLDNLYNRAGFQKEVMTHSGTFTDDASRAHFMPNWLHTGAGWNLWRTHDHWTSTEPPLREYLYANPYVGYGWMTWVQN
jgi:hypothetical protein